MFSNDILVSFIITKTPPEPSHYGIVAVEAVYSFPLVYVERQSTADPTNAMLNALPSKCSIPLDYAKMPTLVKRSCNEKPCRAC